MARSTKNQQSPDEQPVTSPSKRPDKNKNRRSRPGDHLQYSSDPSLIRKEIAEHCAQHPWYAKLRDSVLGTLNARATVHEYKAYNPQARTQSNHS